MSRQRIVVAGRVFLFKKEPMWNSLRALFKTKTPEVSQFENSLEATKPKTINATPDTTVSFGYKTSWFAVKSNTSEEVASFLGLSSLTKANWDSGIYFKNPPFDNSDGRRVFVTPSIDGWVLIDTAMNHAADTETNIRSLEKLLCDLSREFEEAQYFGSYRIVDYAAWYKARHGEILRGYSFAGGADGYFVNTGSTTKAELNLGFGDISKVAIDDLNLAPHASHDDDGISKWPDEDDPALIAEAWSVNPLTLEDRADLQPDVGFLGLLP